MLFDMRRWADVAAPPQPRLSKEEYTAKRKADLASSYIRAQPSIISDFLEVIKKRTTNYLARMASKRATEYEVRPKASFYIQMRYGANVPKIWYIQKGLIELATPHIKETIIRPRGNKFEFIISDRNQASEVYDFLRSENAKTQLRRIFMTNSIKIVWTRDPPGTAIRLSGIPVHLNENQTKDLLFNQAEIETQGLTTWTRLQNENGFARDVVILKYSLPPTMFEDLALCKEHIIPVCGIDIGWAYEITIAGYSDRCIGEGACGGPHSREECPYRREKNEMKETIATSETLTTETSGTLNKGAQYDGNTVPSMSISAFETRWIDLGQEGEPDSNDEDQVIEDEEVLDVPTGNIEDEIMGDEQVTQKNGAIPGGENLVTKQGTTNDPEKGWILRNHAEKRKRERDMGKSKTLKLRDFIQPRILKQLNQGRSPTPRKPMVNTKEAKRPREGSGGEQRDTPLSQQQ